MARSTSVPKRERIRSSGRVKGFIGEGGEQEWNTESDRIAASRTRAARHARLRSGHSQNGGQDRTDAGNPAEREGRPIT